MGKIIRVKSIVWEEYFFDDEEYAEVIDGLRYDTMKVHEMYEKSYDNEISYDSIDPVKDIDGQYTVQDDDGNDVFTGRPTSGTTVIKYPVTVNDAWKPGQSFKDNDEELIL